MYLGGSFTITGFPGGSGVKNLPATQETQQEKQIRSLGWEDALEQEMATHSSTLAWKIPWTEKPGRLQSIGSERLGHYWATEHTHTHTHIYHHMTSLLFSILPKPFSCSFLKAIAPKYHFRPKDLPQLLSTSGWKGTSSFCALLPLTPAKHIYRIIFIHKIN